MSAKLRIIHASPGLPALDVLIDGKMYIKALYHMDDSSYLDIPAGEHEIQVYNSNSFWPLVGPYLQNFEDGEAYTLLVTGHAYEWPGLQVKILHDTAMPMAKAA